MDLKLSGKTILLTGASSGIGKEVAYKAASQGAQLILCARRLEKLEEIKAHCQQLGAKDVKVFSLDLSKPETTDELMEFLFANHLTIDVLINNAGFGHSDPFIEMDFAQVISLFKVNVFGLMYLTQKVAIKMLEQETGQIINVASLAGKVATPDYSIYDATKGAVISFSNALRMELAPFNIQVTVVNFGPVNTPFFEQIESTRKEKGQNGLLTLSAERAGKIVTDAIGRNKREINAPFLLNLGAKLHHLVPTIGDYILMHYYNK